MTVGPFIRLSVVVSALRVFLAEVLGDIKNRRAFIDCFKDTTYPYPGAPLELLIDSFLEKMPLVGCA